MLSETYPRFQKNLNTGYFLSGGIRYSLNRGSSVNSGTGGYYGIYLERWKNTSALNSSETYKRTKLNIVGGSNVGLFGNFTLDFEYGVTLGLYTVSGSTNQTSQSIPLVTKLQI